jgi:hypothetical protein
MQANRFDAAASETLAKAAKAGTDGNDVQAVAGIGRLPVFDTRHGRAASP